MYRIISRALCAFCIPAVSLGIIQAASAEAVRAFAGSYQLSNIVEAGNSVDITMTLILRNPTTTDVRGGTVIVLDTQPHHSVLGSFAAIKSLPHLGAVKVTENFTISADEYARWQTGQEPIFQFLVPNGDGTSIEGIQVHRTTKPGKEIN